MNFSVGFLVIFPIVSKNAKTLFFDLSEPCLKDFKIY